LTVQPAVFLDRDNTLILNEGDLGDPEAVRLADGVPAGLKSLREAGYSLVVVTNQAGVARGRFTEDEVDSVHQRIATLVDAQARTAGLIDRFYYCPYHPDATVAEYRRDHPWRKPHPGMILQAARDMGIDLSRSWMIGDQERDIVAGHAAGCRTVLVTRDAALAQRLQPTEVAATFSEAVQYIRRHAQQLTRPPSNGIADDHPSVNRFGALGSAEARSKDAVDWTSLRRAIGELTEEIRSDRLRRTEFTFLRMVAGVCQLLALLLALLGMLQLSNTDVFLKWMIGAGLMQMVTITLLVLDLKA
jgi:D-glycero-D-manno-heptose 1,7-bisphosphate phosphatase